jgi:hypothetical protein
MNPIAIDPPGCGCTECIIGEYVPLDEATPAQIADLLAGRIVDNTNSSTEFTVTIRVTAENDGLTWDLNPAMLGIAVTKEN